MYWLTKHQNAGISSVSVPLEETSLADFSQVLNTNLIGPFLCTREAIRIFKRQSPQGGVSSPASDLIGIF